MARHEDISALVLAGGRATRMGGRDKGLIPLAGKPLVAHVIERLAPQVGQLLINANRHREDYAGFGHPVLADTLADYQGPLAGMLAGLEQIDTALLLTAPCDSPLPPLDYAERMLAARREADAEIAVATDGERWQPVFCLLGRELATSLEAFLAAGDRKIDRWFASHRTVAVNFSDQPQAFANINSPAELTAMEQSLAP